MFIHGIKENCVKCKECINECPSLLFQEDENNNILFQDDKNWCIQCGHCIAVCPVNAIEYKEMDLKEINLEKINLKDQLPLHDQLELLIMQKRSVRRYQDKPIIKEDLEKIFSTINYYPSSSNMRTLKFKLISDKQLIVELSRRIVEVLLSNPAFKTSYGEKIEIKKERGKDPVFHDAPHVLICYSSVDFNLETINSTIALTYGMLAAETLGIGSCWIGFAQMALNESKELKKAARVRGTVHGVITLGYPDVKFKKIPPRPKIKLKK
ncbi:MAG: nitroreductase family protein [Promethearchaeota archaeon]